MAIALIIVAAVLIIVIAFYAVGHAVATTDAMPDQIVVDMHEAIEFCAEALPVDATAVLSYDELRRLLRLHTEWIQAYHWAPDTPEQSDAGPIVFEQFDALPYVLERAEITGLDVPEHLAAAAIEAHSTYLQVAGAIHLENPADVEQDLAQLPLLEAATDEPAHIEGAADNGGDHANTDQG